MKRKVFVAVPTVGDIADSQTYVLRDLERTYKDHVEFIYPKQCVRRMFHDFARNAMVEEFLESEAEVLWFLDSDVTPAKHVLDLVALYWDKWEVSAAPYPVFMTPPGDDTPQVVFTIYKGDENKLYPSKIPYEGQELVQGAATGCLFIKRQVLEKMSKPYFEFKYHPETRELAEGEDLGFCKKLNKMGIQTFVDYSMVCKHYKKVCLLDVNNYATSLSNRNLQAYDKTMRGQIEVLVDFIKRKKGNVASSSPQGVSEQTSSLILVKPKLVLP